MGLNRDDILKDGAPSRALPVQDVDVPEWGGPVYVRTLMGWERDAFETSAAGKGSLANVRGRFAALVVCDEAGKRLFTDDDAGELGRLNGAGLDRVWEAGAKLNRMGAGAREEALKN